MASLPKRVPAIMRESTMRGSFRSSRAEGGWESTITLNNIFEARIAYTLRFRGINGLRRGNPRLHLTNEPHRELIYRMSYQMGRHIIGYEVQKVLAAVDWFERKSPGGHRSTGGFLWVSFKPGLARSESSLEGINMFSAIERITACLQCRFVLSLLCLGVAGSALVARAQSTGTFTPTESMRTPRTDHTATLLLDGRVLITGGLLGGFAGPLAGAELYDPGTHAFAPAGNMTTARAQHTATFIMR
jgi:hypothetical protein